MYSVCIFVKCVKKPIWVFAECANCQAMRNEKGEKFYLCQYFSFRDLFYLALDLLPYFILILLIQRHSIKANIAWYVQRKTIPYLCVLYILQGKYCALFLFDIYCNTLKIANYMVLKSCWTKLLHPMNKWLANTWIRTSNFSG